MYVLAIESSTTSGGVAILHHSKLIGTMDALALRAAHGTESPVRVCTLLDARQGEVFAGLYDVSMESLEVTQVHALHAAGLETLVEWIDRRTVFAGDAALKHQEQLILSLIHI